MRIPVKSISYQNVSTFLGVVVTSLADKLSAYIENLPEPAPVIVTECKTSIKSTQKMDARHQKTQKIMKEMNLRAFVKQNACKFPIGSALSPSGSEQRITTDRLYRKDLETKLSNAKQRIFSKSELEVRGCTFGKKSRSE